MNLATISTGLSALFDSLTGLTNSGPDNGETVYPDDANQARVTFRLTSAVGVGDDELRTEYDPDAVIEGDTSGPGGTPATGGVIYSTGGARILTYTVKCECGRQDITAGYFIERIRTRLGLPSANRALQALGLGLANFRSLGDFSGVSAVNREVSIGLAELVLNAADNASDEPVTTIKRVIGTAGDQDFDITLGTP